MRRDDKACCFQCSDHVNCLDSLGAAKTRVVHTALAKDEASASGNPADQALCLSFTLRDSVGSGNARESGVGRNLASFVLLVFFGLPP